MPPQAQEYIYENPQTHERVKWDGKAWVPLGPQMSAEAAAVAAAPKETDPARFKEKISRPITERTMVLSQGTGAPGIPVTGTDKQLEAPRKAQKDLAIASGAMLGGELVAPLVNSQRVWTRLTQSAGVYGLLV